MKVIKEILTSKNVRYGYILLLCFTLFASVLVFTACAEPRENPMPEYSMNSATATEKEYVTNCEYQTEQEPAVLPDIIRRNVLSVSGSHSAAILSDGSLWVWGFNRQGLLGGTNRYKPMQIGTGTDWVSVAAGSGFTLALKNDGSLWSWGGNRFGRLGDGTTEDRFTPMQIGVDGEWVYISAGNLHAAAIRTDGSLWTWGRNTDGQLGDATTINRYMPVRVGTDTDWVSVAAGSSHTKALKSDGSLWVWGLNRGEFGDGVEIDPMLAFHPQTTPIQIGADTDWVSVAVGLAHTLAIKEDGSLWAWGWNWFGQLGDSTTEVRFAPVQVGTDTDWAIVAAGANFSLATKEDGSLWAWGDNQLWRLGFCENALSKTQTLVPLFFDPRFLTPVILTPTQIGADTNWVSVAAFDHVVAVRADGSIWHWGLGGREGIYGLLGDNTTGVISNPARIMIACEE